MSSASHHEMAQREKMEREKGTYQRRKRQALAEPPCVIVTLLVTLFAWIVGYACSVGYPMQIFEHTTPLYKLILSGFTSKAAAYLFGLILLSLSAFLHKQCNYALVIIKGKSLIPFLLFFTFVSTNSLLYPFQEASFALPFFILAIYFLMRSYQDHQAIGVLFNSMFFLSLGSLFWAHLVWFIPLFFVGLYLLRSLSLRNLLAAFLGLMIPLSLVLAWSVWNEDYALFVIPFNALLSFDFSFNEITFSFEWINIMFVLLLLVVSAIHLFLHEFESSLRTRHYLLFLLTMGLYSFFLMLIYSDERLGFLLILYLPSSVFLSYFFNERRRMHMVYLYYFMLFFLFLLMMSSLWRLF